MGATAEAEATKAAQIAGIEHARKEDRRYKGRDLLAPGRPISLIARTTGLSRQAVPEEAVANLVERSLYLPFFHRARTLFRDSGVKAGVRLKTGHNRQRGGNQRSGPVTFFRTP